MYFFMIVQSSHRNADYYRIFSFFDHFWWTDIKVLQTVLLFAIFLRNKYHQEIEEKNKSAKNLVFFKNLHSFFILSSFPYICLRLGSYKILQAMKQTVIFMAGIKRTIIILLHKRLWLCENFAECKLLLKYSTTWLMIRSLNNLIYLDLL